MKIVFIAPFGLKPKGTVSVRALPIAKALAARGHKVTILIPTWDDPDMAGQLWEDEGVQVVNLPLPVGVPLLFHVLLTVSLVARAVALRPDVIHCFKPKAYAGLSHLLLWWFRTLRGITVKLVVDADDWEQAWNEIAPYSIAKKKLFAWQEKWGLSYADAITVASRALENMAAEQTGRDSTDIFYLPNGCGVNIKPGTADTVRKNLQWGDAPVILLYSRFLEFRLERVVKLVKLVSEQLPQSRWLVVGCGLCGEEKRLEELLSEAGLGEYAHFTGWLDIDYLPAHFRAADVAVFPYDDTIINRTKCSVKLIDLLTAGLPVVADAVGQNCEYIQNGQSGILVTAEDDTAFAEALLELLQLPAKREKLGQAAAQYMKERFTWAKLAQELERAYNL